MSHIVKMISGRERKRHVEYRRVFQEVYGIPGNGFAFPCDKYGNLNLKDNNYDYWIKNYHYCVEHPSKYKDCGVEKDAWEYTENARALCSCGAEIELWDQYLGACECPKCKQWYNLFGEALINPEYWEEDY